MKWTSEAVTYLKDYYSVEGAEHCAKHLDRTINAVRLKASRLKLQGVDSWTPQEVVLLETYYPTKGLDYCIDVLSRTRTSVLGKAKRLGLRSGIRISEQPSALYYVYFPKLELYKVGITCNYERRSYEFGQETELLDLIEFSTGNEAYQEEQKLLKALSPYMSNKGLLNSGNTETFLWPENPD